MSKSLYEIGKAGLRQFVVALGEVIEKDVELTPEQARGVPEKLREAEERLLQAWDEVCEIRYVVNLPGGRKGDAN